MKRPALVLREIVVLNIIKRLLVFMVAASVKNLVKENLLKHLLIVLVSVFSYNAIYSTLSSVSVSATGNFLSIVSILLVTVCFANFGFTYEHSKMANPRMRILSHATTFIFLLLTALLLEVLVISVGMVYPQSFSVVLVFSG